ncbi:hypothetical protein NMG60_11030170 [Bertholletia excelsa]
MAVRLRQSRSTVRLSSQSLDKFIKTQKNLSKPPPRLWADSQEVHEPTDPGDPGVCTLTLNHPILRRLESCSGVLREFNQVHAQLVVSGLFQHSLVASRVVKKLCSSPSTVSHAIYLFDCFEEPDAFICNTIIRGVVNSNGPHDALNFYYHRMLRRFVLPNHYTFPLLAKVCAEIGIVKFGFELDLFVRNGLIHMYSVCGKLGVARAVFDMSSDLDLVSWNSMIDGYVKNGQVDVAQWLFDEMPERDSFSWNSMIAGYVATGDMETAKELFGKMPSRDVVSWNSMIDGYARTGNISAARECFDWMPFRNIISWNTMLALYVRCKDYHQCLGLFDRMMEDGNANPNEATLVSVLTACAHLGKLDKDCTDVLLLTALLTMYAKCGAIDLARDVFDEMPNKTVVSWNSMIMGYGMHSSGEKALEMFLAMEKNGVRPNDATFICILSVCAHAGMVLEGWWYFNLMRQVYMIEPKVEHYGCMVDLLSRAGLVEDSEELINKMPMNAGPVLWSALLSACRSHSNLELGEIVAKQLIELAPGDIGPYVLLSNIYAAGARWHDVENVRRMMTKRGLQKVAGSSLVESGNLCAEFCEGSGSIHKRNVVYSMLKEMGNQMKLSCSSIEG